MYLNAEQVRDLVRESGWSDCTNGRLCYAAPMPPEEEDSDRRPYGVPLDEFLVEFPIARDRADVAMLRCPGAAPWLVVWLLPGEAQLPLPSAWRGYRVEQRTMPSALAGLGAPESSGEQTIPEPPVRGAAFPLAPVAILFGVILGGFVLSFFVKRSPTGRWYLG